MLFTIATKWEKLRISLTIKMKNLRNKNIKSQNKEIAEVTRKSSYTHGLLEII